MLCGLMLSQGGDHSVETLGRLADVRLGEAEGCQWAVGSNVWSCGPCSLYIYQSQAKPGFWNFHLPVLRSGLDTLKSQIPWPMWYLVLHGQVRQGVRGEGKGAWLCSSGGRRSMYNITEVSSCRHTQGPSQEQQGSGH